MWSHTTRKLLLAAGLLAISAQASTSMLTNSRSALNACNILAVGLPGKVALAGDISYVQGLATYYTYAEQHVTPACIVSPTCAQNVSFIINTVSNENANFAIRGGGHTLWAGAANVEGGITINLRSMNAVSVNDAKDKVSIGGGAKWGEVYGYLDTLDLATYGGRVADIGVGGLTTGGGISFFSQKTGWVCDNVLNFEVVLASGAVINANSIENPLLFQALKGGSNNFGVVTRFDIQAFAQGAFYGGQITVPEVYGVPSVAPSKLKAFADAIALKDEDTSVILQFGRTKEINFINSILQYTKSGVTDPPNLKAFTHAADPAQIANTMRMAQMKSFTDEIAGTLIAGQRINWGTTTFVGDVDMLTTMYNLFNATIAKINPDSEVQWFSIIQPAPYNGQTLPNSLGLPHDLFPSRLTIFLIGYAGAVSDAEAFFLDGLAKQLIADIEAAAKKSGKYQKYKYLNYAAAWQDPIGSYGLSSYIILKTASAIYDPAGLFQKQCPGGYKLAAANPSPF